MPDAPRHIYRAYLRPVSFCTLPDDIAKSNWEFIHQPNSLDGGMFGVIAVHRKLTEDEQSRFGLMPPKALARSA